MCRVRTIASYECGSDYRCKWWTCPTAWTEYHLKHNMQYATTTSRSGKLKPICTDVKMKIWALLQAQCMRTNTSVSFEEMLGQQKKIGESWTVQVKSCQCRAHARKCSASSDRSEQLQRWSWPTAEDTIQKNSQEGTEESIQVGNAQESTQHGWE
ncbi:hypothetical protein EJ05DRAFT_157223 [Pseudovirgaria hyperparasitica]|uniref:Uncharacterized protein n=1 Tax=Pseudovirgaria hyperparasitica TaxID=470096 RepID=A0A6A6VVN8_9PEZI|nr:uncharacterized protein EJ05DRAFT_157223 [Pseudovirgaria hyperparasitica]KAF2753856.1 hypothetical protein EJ05DRAFT_157223 [Pseudovirgaria hyperparasitica]